MDYLQPERADFEGLRQLWPAEGTVFQPSADFVIVHGLAGGIISSFLHPNGSFWPEWIGVEIPDIRIFGFGYEANKVYFKDPSKQGEYAGRVFTFAEDLCVALRDKRIHNSVPITFFGHGVGGLIIKNALTYANARRLLFGDIIQNTKHIMFFDTPHRGCDVSVWKAIYGSVGNRHAEEQFGLWSSGLRDLSRTFSEIGNRIPITSCYATEATVLLGEEYRVINESSASLDYQFEVLRYLYHVSHLTMCKYANLEDSNYRFLRDRIKFELAALETTGADGDEMAEQADNANSINFQETNLQLQMIKDQLSVSDAKLDKIQSDNKTGPLNVSINEPERVAAEQQKLRRKILKWLYSPKKGVDFESDLDAQPQATENTCSWITEHNAFKSWQRTQDSNILWLHGIQGCGNSTIVSWLTRRFLAQSKDVFYFYCTEDAFRSGTFTLGCLIHQMVSRKDKVPDILIHRYEKSTYPTISSISTARLILQDVARTYKSCYIFIDALDECHDRVATITALLNIVKEVPTGIKILCSSRDELDIQRLLQQQPSVSDLSICPGDISLDINTFISRSIQDSADLSEKLGPHPEAYRFVLSSLETAAQGMFLLPKFMIEDLELKSTLEEIYQFFDNLPSGLFSYYLKILVRIDERWHSFARKIITWMVWAKRPLSLEEMQEALSLDGSTFIGLRSDIKKALGCLVSIDSGKVRLSHSSVKRFFQSSVEFKNHVLYQYLTIENPKDFLADTCTNYLFKGTYGRPSPPSRRFRGRDPQRLRINHPFIEYCALNWLNHCREASDPYIRIPQIRRFMMSTEFLLWYEALATFIPHESPLFIFRTFKTWILKLKMGISYDLNPSTITAGKVERLLDDLGHIGAKLSLLWNFLELWDEPISCYPDEIYTLAPLIQSPDVSSQPGSIQRILFATAGRGRDSKRLYNLLDRRQLRKGFDRFMLSDFNIFMWQSLMPSKAVEGTLEFCNDATSPAKINLCVESIETGTFHARRGIDDAEVGSITNTAILRRDLRAMAIVWARYSDDKTKPLAVKTYAWYVGEERSSHALQRIEWTDEDDPSRVDLTISHGFRMSKGAVAFSNDGTLLWTAGGVYDVDSGAHKEPPAVFHDPELTSITFSRNASMIAAIRSKKGVEIYSIPEGNEIATLRRDFSKVEEFSMLGVSPNGNFVLFLRKQLLQESIQEDVCLLKRNGDSFTLWSSPATEARNADEVSPLEYFYGSGGLHAFSENEIALVLCVPERSDWAILAFDLSFEDITSTRWEVDYSAPLVGAGILSFSFCPIHERRLYILDTFAVMRALEISKISHSSASSIATVESADIPPVLSAVSRSGTLFTATREDDDIMSRFWDLKTLCPTSNSLAPASFLRDLLLLKSQDLAVNLDGICDMLNITQSFRLDSNQWRRVCVGAQNAIDVTSFGMMEVDKVEDLSAASEKRDLSPRVLTNVSFNSPATTLGFFQSLIYVPIPSVEGQYMWNATMFMDVRWLDTPKARKTGAWSFATVGSVYGEHLAVTFHPESQTVAYSASVTFYDKSAKSKGHWFTSTLCICNLSPHPFIEEREDDIGTYLKSKAYTLDVGEVTCLEFSKCGCYVYGISILWPSAVFQFDLSQGKVSKTINDPFNLQPLAAMSLSFYEDDVFVIGVDNVSVVGARLPFRPNSRYELVCLAIGPSSLSLCHNIKIIWPKSTSSDIIIMVQGKSFMRKNGNIGGNLQWPVVLAVKEQDIGEWIPLVERKLTRTNTLPEEKEESEISDNWDGTSGLRHLSFVGLRGTFQISYRKITTFLIQFATWLRRLYASFMLRLHV